MSLLSGLIDAKLTLDKPQNLVPPLQFLASQAFTLISAIALARNWIRLTYFIEFPEVYH